MMHSLPPAFFFFFLNATLLFGLFAHAGTAETKNPGAVFVPSGIRSQPGRVALLPPLSAAVIEGLKRQAPLETKRRLQIVGARNLDHPILVNRETARATEWTVLSNGWRILSV